MFCNNKFTATKIEILQFTSARELSNKSYQAKPIIGLELLQGFAMEIDTFSYVSAIWQDFQ